MAIPSPRARWIAARPSTSARSRRAGAATATPGSPWRPTSHEVHDLNRLVIARAREPPHTHPQLLAALGQTKPWILATCRSPDRPLQAQPARHAHADRQRRRDHRRHRRRRVDLLARQLRLHVAARRRAGGQRPQPRRLRRRHPRSSTSAPARITRDGYLLHKYTPSGALGSSWHPLDGRRRQAALPIQEDETALVVYALWQHYTHLPRGRVHPPALPSAHQGRGRLHGALPRATHQAAAPSWDLWEERRGIHAYTVAAVYAGLDGGGALRRRRSARRDRGERIAQAARRSDGGATISLARRQLGASCARSTCGPTAASRPT